MMNPSRICRHFSSLATGGAWRVRSTSVPSIE